MADASFVGTNQFFDTKKVAVNLEMRWQNSQSFDGIPYGLRCTEMYFPPQDTQIVETADVVQVHVRGLCYGDIGAISNFTSGIES